MANKMEIAGLSLRDKLHQAAKHHSGTLAAAALFLVGFTAAQARMVGGLAPFGAAVAACVQGPLWMPASLGALLGYLFSLGGSLNLKYVCTSLLIACVKWLTDGRVSQKIRLAAAPLTAWGAMTLSGLLVAWAYGFRFYDVAMAAAEGFLACGITYFFGKAAGVLRLRQSFFSMKRTDGGCVIVALCLSVTALATLEISGVSLGRILAGVVILLCALLGRESMATLAGVACGTSVILASTGQGHLLGVYALGGLFAGLFSPLGRLGCCGAFLFTGGLVNLLTGDRASLAPVLFELAASCLVFLLIPREGIAAVRDLAFRRLERSRDDGMRQILMGRLTDAAFALEDIAGTTRKAAQKLGELSAADPGEIYSQAADKVCRKCGKRICCWQAGYQDTMDCLMNLSPVLRKNGSVEAGDFGAPLDLRCPNKPRLAASVTESFQQFQSKESLRRKLSRIRCVVTDQFEGMSQLLESIALEAGTVTPDDSRTGAQIQDYLEQLGIGASQVVSCRDRDGRSHVRIQLPASKAARINRQALADELSQICECQFAAPSQKDMGEYTLLTLCEKAALKARVAVSQHSFENGRLCGDSCSFFHDRSGGFHLLLSDGMGSGSAAAVDSTMTVSLLRKLLEGGVDHSSALKLVNSALLVKSGEESLSTVDALYIDLYTGKATFYKAGAAPTFVRKSGRTGYVESASMPVGILADASFEKSTASLHQGDLVVMLSDGAVAGGSQWIKATLDHFDGDDLQALCDDIVKTARLRRPDAHDDDVTAMAVLLEKAG